MFWSVIIFYDCNDDTAGLQRLSLGYKLYYDTIPVKSASANFFFYTNKLKMPNFELWHSCRKWAIFCRNYNQRQNVKYTQLLAADARSATQIRQCVVNPSQNNLFLPDVILNLTFPLRIIGKQLNRVGCSSSLKCYLRDLGHKKHAINMWTERIFQYRINWIWIAR
jgi:hypothetical protein